MEQLRGGAKTGVRSQDSACAQRLGALTNTAALWGEDGGAIEKTTLCEDGGAEVGLRDAPGA